MLVLLFIVGALIALVVVGLAVLPMFIDEQAIINLAQQQVRETTGGELVIEGNVDLALFPELKINLGSTTIDLPPQTEGGSRLVITAQEVDVGLSVLAIASGADEVGDVHLSGADVKVLDSQGMLQTQLTVTDLVAQGLNIAGQPIGLNGALAIAPDPQSQPIQIRFNGAIRIPSTLDRVTLDGLNTEIIGALSEPVQTELSGSANLSPLSADLKLNVDSPGGIIDADLNYNVAASPQIDLNFRSERLDLDRIQPANQNDNADNTASSSSAAVTANTPASPAPAPPPLPLPVGPLKDLDMQLTISAGSLISAGQTVTNAQLLLRVVDGISDLKYLRGTLHEGQLDTRLTVDVRKPVARVSLTGGLKGVELNSLLTSLDKPDTAAGHVDMDWTIDTAGSSAQALQEGLDGVLNVNGRNAEITSVSAQTLMCTAVAQIQQTTLTQSFPETTEVSTLDMKVVFADGQARLAPLSLGTPGVAISGVGTASLASLDFAATLKAQINEELEAIDPACRIDDRYTGLDLPVNCAGNLADEAGNLCRVDIEAIATQLLEREARSKFEKEAEKLGEKASSALKKLFGN
ncbi:AsmA family protein [Draconibacterium sp.]|nr:AsmA family protein [Luminiphilus sp.]MDB2352261.1 AsmA family protein [Luminiphilus sp.]MDB4582129.1 AsmA family protein [Draconibacterium sp.]